MLKNTLLPDHWTYWKVEINKGRSQWRFCPPSRYAQQDWSGNLDADAQKFLEQMSLAFIFNKKANPNSGDKVYRTACEAATEKVAESPANDVKQTASRGIAYYEKLQTPDGCWPGDYGGPMFLLPGLIIASHVTESPFPAPHRTMMTRYMLNHQNADGGWGLHIEGESTMFGTVLQYVSLRLLGMDADEAPCAVARQWILEHGGATAIPSWGKFYLSVLGVYEWDGCNSLCPEMWLLPESLSFHPSRYWCHTRMVYLPMAYCYGHRVTAAHTPLTDALRNELYTQDYSTIDWPAARDKCAATDIYYPQAPLLTKLNKLLNIYEKFHLRFLREKALDFVLEYINAEDVQTNYINIGPVNQVINSICVWHQYGADSLPFRKHREHWDDYLWVAEDGMKMQGYNGSQLWDTAFALQAVIEGGFENEYPELTARAYNFIEQSQIRTEVVDREKFYRHIQIGGWPFSTVDHGWPISDCTAEGLKSVMAYGALKGKIGINNERKYQAVNVLLSYQNTDGGWASYENTRAPEWLEALNPSEIFGGIMIDYSYVECTSACLQSLIRFQQQHDHRSAEITRAIERGISFILTTQREDGSWYGSWAVCFTYGTWFGIEALTQFIANGSASPSLIAKAKTAVDRACNFLLAHQNPDGGWGESFESCIKKEYIHSPASQVVNTSWALMSLLAAKYNSPDRIRKGIDFIISRQLPNGDWPQENISGVFNHNCMISYTAYRNVFPIWALGRYTGWIQLSDH